MKKYMKAMALEGCASLAENRTPLKEKDLPIPEPAGDEIRIRVTACGVCHTELDEIEGRTVPSFFPIVPGHQVIGIVDACGENASRYKPGERVGVGWIYSSCGACEFCRRGQENLCADFKATGRDAHGGYAEFMVARAGFAFPIPVALEDSAAAPLLCAGAVGYRALTLAEIEDGDSLGFSGFGASAHILLKLVASLYPRTRTFVYARSKIQRDFSLALGASWAGDFGQEPPQLLDAIIDTTPVWKPLVSLLPYLKPGGRFVINAIRKEDADKDVLASVSYQNHFWLEKKITSVANVTRSDIAEFLSLAAKAPLIPETNAYALRDANQALLDLKRGDQKGAKVLLPAL
jgi:propanol-preferring alcohol dehydrogenase